MLVKMQVENIFCASVLLQTACFEPEKIMSSSSAREAWRLQHVDCENLPRMGLYGTKLARILRCIDGDTVQVALVVDNCVVVTSVRLCGIDAPEMRPARKDPHREAIKREANAAKRELETLLPVGALCMLHCCGPLDCYGRVLANKIYYKQTDAVSEMVRRGYAVRVQDNKRCKNWLEMFNKLQDQRLACIEEKAQQLARSVAKTKPGFFKRLFCCIKK